MFSISFLIPIQRKQGKTSQPYLFANQLSESSGTHKENRGGWKWCVSVTIMVRIPFLLFVFALLGEQKGLAANTFASL